MDTKISVIDACMPTNSNVGCPSNDIVSPIQSLVSPSVIASSEATLSNHLARRLVQTGINDVFSVPRDF